MRPLLIALAFLLCVGCAAQARPDEASQLPRDTVELETRRHGNYGYQIARTFRSAKFQAILNPDEGERQRFGATEFYSIHIARDATRRENLSPVGYARRRVDTVEGGQFYEFFDNGWRLIAVLSSTGRLLEAGQSGKLTDLGGYQLDSALLRLYRPEGAFGIDTTRVDLARSNFADQEVVTNTPEGRGVVLRTYDQFPAKVELRRLQPTVIAEGKSSLLEPKFETERKAELAALRKARLGDAAEGEYGGLRYVDGMPVDENGRPLRPGSLVKPAGD